MPSDNEACSRKIPIIHLGRKPKKWDEEWESLRYGMSSNSFILHVNNLWYYFRQTALFAHLMEKRKKRKQ
ncbi:30S ribosomal protein [Dirofilaria immitis]